MNESNTSSLSDVAPQDSILSGSIREKRQWLKDAYAARQDNESSRTRVTRPSERARQRSWLGLTR